MQSQKSVASAGGRAAAHADDNVFDQAQSRRASNDNHYLRLVCDDPEDMPRRQKQKPFRGDELRAEIPADKAAARAWLNALGVGASVSMSVACSNAGLPDDRGWRGEAKEPPEPKAWNPRKRNAANSNEPENWPLMESLRRDGRHDDIPSVERYWSLVEATGGEPLSSTDFLFDGAETGGAPAGIYGSASGIGAAGEAGMGVEARSLKLHGERDVNRAHEAGWPSEKVPGGNISYRERRHTVQQMAVSTGQRMLAANEDSTAQTQAPLSFANPEDAIIDRIDGKMPLAALRVEMGGKTFAFEDAALGRLTLTKVGEYLGHKNKARSAKAKVLVYTAIDRLRGEWRLVDRYRAEMAEVDGRRVEARRREIAAAHAAYLGRAA